MNGTATSSAAIPAATPSVDLGVTMTASLIKVIPNSKLEELERKQEEEAKKKTAAVVLSLASFIDSCFVDAKRVRQTIEQTIIDDRKQVKGLYRSDVLAEIQKFGGSETFIQHTGNKCSAAQSWIQDIVLPPDEFPASIEPTPIPDLPEPLITEIVQNVTQHFKAILESGGMVETEAVVQMASDLREKQLAALKEEAERRAKRMERKIFDQLTEANFVDVLLDVIANLIQTPAGVLKGPVVRSVKVLTWGINPETGTTIPMVEKKLTLQIASVDPVDMYPSPNSRTVDDGYLIERVRSTRQELRAMIGVEGYNDAEINAALKEYGAAGLQTLQVPDSDRATLENRDGSATFGMGTADATIEGLEFWGSVQGRKLKEWGMEIPEDDLTQEIDVCCQKYGSHVVKAVFNPDPLGRKPYYMANFEEESGSVWGKGLPEIIRDIQDILNGCVRHIQNNLAISSGPQVAIDFSKLAHGFDWKNMHPWKVWPFDSSTGTTPPIVFFQPTTNVELLLRVYDKFDAISDDQTVPKYSYGNQQVVGAAATATGLSMLMNAANKRIKKVIAGIDRRLLRPILERFYVYNMLYDEDESIKGDVRIVPRGAMALIVKEQMQMRREAFLNSTANPIDVQIIGIKGRARLLREVAQALAIPVDKIVPSDEEIDRQIAEMAAQARAAQAGATPGQPGVPAQPEGQPVGTAEAIPATAPTAAVSTVPLP